MKAISTVYIGEQENPRVILNTLLGTLFSSSSAHSSNNMKKELKVIISIQEINQKKASKNER